MLYRVEAAAAGADAPVVPLYGPAIVLAEGGEVRLRGAPGEATVARGDAVYVTPDEGGMVVAGDGSPGSRRPARLRHPSTDDARRGFGPSRSQPGAQAEHATVGSAWSAAPSGSGGA